MVYSAGLRRCLIIFVPRTLILDRRTRTCGAPSPPLVLRRSKNFTSGATVPSTQSGPIGSGRRTPLRRPPPSARRRRPPPPPPLAPRPPTSSPLVDPSPLRERQHGWGGGPGRRAAAFVAWVRHSSTAAGATTGIPRGAAAAAAAAGGNRRGREYSSIPLLSSSPRLAPAVPPSSVNARHWCPGRAPRPAQLQASSGRCLDVPWTSIQPFPAAEGAGSGNDAGRFEHTEFSTVSQTQTGWLRWWALVLLSGRQAAVPRRRWRSGCCRVVGYVVAPPRKRRVGPVGWSARPPASTHTKTTPSTPPSLSPPLPPIPPAAAGEDEEMGRARRRRRDDGGAAGGGTAARRPQEEEIHACCLPTPACGARPPRPPVKGASGRSTSHQFPG